MRILPYFKLAIFCLTGHAIVAASSLASDGTWAVDADGNWSDASNWQSLTVASGTNSTATFPDIITSNHTITLDIDATIGNITASDADKDYTITGASTLTLATSSGTPNIDVSTSGRNLYIRNPITGSNGLQKSGLGTLWLSSTGSVSTTHAVAGNISINGGILRIDNYGLLGAGGDFSNNITMSPGTGIYVAREDGGPTQIFSGDISGDGYVRAARRDVVLSGTNTYTGYTWVSPDTTRPTALTVSSLNSVNGGTPLLPSSSMGCPTSVVDGTITLGSTAARATATLVYIGPGETTDRNVDVRCNQYAKDVIQADGTGLLKFTGDFTAARAGLYDDKWGLILSGTGDGEIVDGIPVTDGSFEKQGSGTWTIGGPGEITVRSTIKAGTLHLNGTNALGTGIVLVSGGTLSADVSYALGANSVAVTNAALVLTETLSLFGTNSLSIGGTGTVQIDQGVKARVESLYIDGAAQSTGSWGALGGSAENTDSHFTGLGKLYVGVDIPAEGMVLIVR